MAPHKRRFSVVTDSTCDFTPSQAAEHDVHVVPLTVTIGDETFSDGVLSQQELHDRMQAPAVPATTSQPSVGKLVEAYEHALETAESVLAIHISSKLSGTLEAAHAAAQQLAGRVHVFDSRDLSWGLAWQVVDAARAAREGLGIPEALEVVARTRDRVKMIVTLDSLENLRKSGRIGAVSSMLGSMLQLKVTVIVDPNGAFAPARGSRGDKAALRFMLEWVGKHMGSARSGRFAVGHTLSAEKAQTLADAIKERWEARELVMYEAGSTISVHAGTIWGVTFTADV